MTLLATYNGTQYELNIGTIGEKGQGNFLKESRNYTAEGQNPGITRSNPGEHYIL